LNGHCGQKTKFSGTAIQVEQTGCLFIYVKKYNEEYALSLPELYLRGIMTGAPFVELTGETLVVCSAHKIAAKLLFLAKPWFSGEYNLTEGIIYDDTNKDIKYEIWGNWAKKIYIESKELDPNETHLANIECGIVDTDEKATILFDTASPILHPKVGLTQSFLESRNVWKEVTKALIKSDYVRAGDMKNEIEESQRTLRRERASNGIEWMPMVFCYVDKFFLTRLHESSLEHMLDANLSTESLLRLKNIQLGSETESDTSSNVNATFADSTTTLEKQAVEKIKFVGRWVSYEFMDFFEKATSS